jgi:hypothetical protein
VGSTCSGGRPRKINMESIAVTEPKKTNPIKVVNSILTVMEEDVYEDEEMVTLQSPQQDVNGLRTV